MCYAAMYLVFPFARRLATSWVPLVFLLVATMVALTLVTTEMEGVALIEYGPGHCQDCGYNLTGLTSARCPECGRTLEAEEVVSDEAEH